MGQVLDEKLNMDNDLYEKYLKEARKKIDPTKISDDEDGTLYWFFHCLYEDCKSHDFINSRLNYNDELKLAAESQVVCEILAARDAKFAIAI